MHHTGSPSELSLGRAPASPNARRKLWPAECRSSAPCERHRGTISRRDSTSRFCSARRAREPAPTDAASCRARSPHDLPLTCTRTQSTPLLPSYPPLPRGVCARELGCSDRPTRLTGCVVNRWRLAIVKRYSEQSRSFWLWYPGTASFEQARLFRNRPCTSDSFPSSTGVWQR